MRSRALAGALALATLPGCGLWEDPPERPRELKQNTVRRQVEVVVQGARNYLFDKPAELVVLAREGSGAQLAASVAALNPKEPLTAGDAQVIPEIGLVGLYTGDGTYVIPAGTGVIKPTTGPTVAPPSAPGKDSNIAVRFLGNPGARYSYLLEPCRVELRSDATEGSVDCPKLAAVDGTTVKFTMKWGP